MKLRILCGSSWLVAALVLVVACAPATSSGASATPGLPGPLTTPAPGASGAGSSGGASTVQMTDALKFDPATVTVARGATVTWRNTSNVQHTVTDDPSKALAASDAQLPSGAQAWDSGTLDPGQSYTHTFDTPGTYKYFCQPHETAGMVGTVVVNP